MEPATHCLEGMYSEELRMKPATHCLKGMFSEQWRMEPATHCLEGMFSTAVQDGTSNTLFRRHVLNCSGGWNQQHIV